MANLTDLPAPLLLERMTFMTFDDVISLCRTNKKLHNICTNDKYRVYWKNMIENTYGNTGYYKQMIKNNPNIKYNYVLYTQLINSLPIHTQSKIYKRQGDYKKADEVFFKKRTVEQLRGSISPKTFIRTSRALPLAYMILSAAEKGKVLDVSHINPDNLHGIKMIRKPGSGSRKVGIETIPVVSSEPENYEVIMKVFFPDNYNKYVDMYIKINENKLAR